MNDGETRTQERGIELTYELDAPPHKVWRAISIPEFRETWLPKEALADPEATSLLPGQEICYRMRENVPPFLESVVTFKIAPNEAGGTSLRIIHEPANAKFEPTTVTAANSNSALALLAA